MERSRIDSPVMIIIADDQRNAELVDSAHRSLLAGTQHCCQYIEADASDRLLHDQRIV